MSHDDFAFEPIRGLPARLPEGEMLLWQGAPRWRALAADGYHVRKAVWYFAALASCRIGFGVANGQSSSAILLSSAFLLVMGSLAIGMLSLLAFLNARSTVYSITNRRVLLRHGIAVPLTMNIPFTLIEAASLRTHAGTGEIAFSVAREQRVGYMITWPHLRPGRFTHPQPCFRALADARHAADILATALAAAGPSAIRIGVESAAHAGVRPRTAAAA